MVKKINLWKKINKVRLDKSVTIKKKNKYNKLYYNHFTMK